jgi:hypothetical protein
VGQRETYPEETFVVGVGAVGAGTGAGAGAGTGAGGAGTFVVGVGVGLSSGGPRFFSVFLVAFSCGGRKRLPFFMPFTVFPPAVGAGESLLRIKDTSEIFSHCNLDSEKQVSKQARKQAKPRNRLWGKEQHTRKNRM